MSIPTKLQESDRHAGDPCAMSASTPIASQVRHRSEKSRSARSDLTHRNKRYRTRIAHGERLYGHVEEGCTNHALLDFTCSCQASAEHFQQCAEFPPLRNRGLGPLDVTVLPIALARRGAATACAAVRRSSIWGNNRGSGLLAGIQWSGAGPP